MAIADFFGSIFTKEIIGKGLGAAFGGGKSSIPEIKYQMPSYGQYGMQIQPTSVAGKAEEIEISNHDVTLAIWQKRLWGDDSYTNITLPRMS